MTRGVFLHREDSRYNDVPTERYHFPRQYLGRASQFVDDWIIYYEPRRGPTGKGYFAIARVQRIVPDPTTADMFFAIIEPGSFLRFERAVAFSGADGVVERGLLNEAGRISGRAQAAVRPISVEDFNRIVDLGFVDAAPLLPRRDGDLQAPALLFREEAASFLHAERERVIYYSSRAVRDRVADLYDPNTMPANLRSAHAKLDAAVDRLYRASIFGSDRDRVEYLFGLYETMVNPLEREGIRQNRLTGRRAARTRSMPSADNVDGN